MYMMTKERVGIIPTAKPSDQNRRRCSCGCSCGVRKRIPVVPSASERCLEAREGDLIIVTRPDGFNYSTGVKRILDGVHYVDHHGRPQHIGRTVRDAYRRDPEHTKVEIVEGGMHKEPCGTCKPENERKEKVSEYRNKSERMGEHR